MSQTSDRVLMTDVITHCEVALGGATVNNADIAF